MKTITYSGKCSHVPVYACLANTTYGVVLQQMVAKVRKIDELVVLAETTLQRDGKDEKFYYVNGPYHEQKGWVEAHFFEEAA